MSNTKEQILLTALKLFAKDGYEAVSTSMIAGELGMTKAALYKHYKNKQDIFDCIMQRMVDTDQAVSQEHGIPTEEYEANPESYQGIDFEESLDYGLFYLRFWTEDSFGINFRRLLTLEQYRNPAAAEMFRNVLGGGVFEFEEAALREMMAEGTIKEDDPKLLALEAYGPTFLLLSLSDTMEDKAAIVELYQKLDERFKARYEIREKFNESDDS